MRFANLSHCIASIQFNSIQFNSIQFNSIQFNSIQFNIQCVSLAPTDPTLRLFQGADVYAPDYRSNRTVAALLRFVGEFQVIERIKRVGTPRPVELFEQEHPGCLLVGHLLVRPVPGNFHVEARSRAHNFAAAAANLSHVVNNLTFGRPGFWDARRVMSPDFDGVKVAPMDG
jgi:hypothetical protein